MQWNCLVASWAGGMLAGVAMWKHAGRNATARCALHEMWNLEEDAAEIRHGLRLVLVQVHTRGFPFVEPSFPSHTREHHVECWTRRKLIAQFN
jgi:hypothetical protein